MKYFAGLDVSLQETFVTIINNNGDIVSEKSVVTEVSDLKDYLLLMWLPFFGQFLTNKKQNYVQQQKNYLSFRI